MARILHLSDLHLSEVNERQVTGDYKDKSLIPLEERDGRLGLLRNSLARLADVIGELDAVVITGDVALKYDEAGFQAFDDTVSCLGDLRPAKDRIVVVPGNHDVKWGSPVSSRERYELFIKHVRDGGYTTPLLEGVDIHGEDAQGAVPSHSPLVRDDDFVIMAVNSANYCVSKRVLPGGDATFAELSNRAKQLTQGMELSEALEKLQIEDVARVSNRQLRAVAETLADVPRPQDGGPLRIAALHHHLLPVTESEEFKPFENITNLGHVRVTFVESDISLVLHGHKHASASFVDNVVLGNLDAPVKSGQYLISSASSVWARHHDRNEFARLVEIRRCGRRTWSVVISSLAYVAEGARADKPTEVARWVPPIDTPPPPVSLVGKTNEDVYGQLLAQFDRDPNRLQRGLICVIQDGASALSKPAQFPSITGVDDMTAWFKDVVDWWQTRDPALEGRARSFNHGQRIRRYKQKIDQVDSVIQALNTEGTTRAVIQLIDQELDDISDASQRIPSFFSVHFLQDVGRRELHCIAYFRKQEMYMWWPVNACEVARLQDSVVGGLASNGKPYTAGSITTISGEALMGRGRPRVLVPRVDRLAQGSPEVLWGMAYDLATTRSVEAQDAILSLLDDWRPTGDVEPDGTALSLPGLHMLSTALSLFGERAGDEQLRELARRVRDMYLANSGYANREEEILEPSTRAEEYRHWIQRVDSITGELRTVLSRIVSGPTTSSSGVH